jgi:alkylhydroperoxidase/carboxymuconolactone decarboxylase family protein YurZ
MADDLLDAAVARGIANFEATAGQVPEGFRLLLRHAPGAFAGYGLLREAAMRSPEKGGALDLRTKELILALLDVLVGSADGAKVHAANAMRQGLTLPELAEGLVQCILVGGITTWNNAGRAVMEHAAAIAGSGAQT